MAEYGGKTGKRRTFHLEIAYLHAFVAERLYLSILPGVLDAQTYLTSLRTVETAAGACDAAYHIISRNAVYQFAVCHSNIWGSFLGAPVHVGSEGLLQSEVADTVAVGIVVEKSVKTDTFYRSNERAERSFGLQTAARADTYDGELAERGLVLPRIEVDIGEGIQFVNHDVYIVATDAGGKCRDTLAFIVAGDGVEFA